MPAIELQRLNAEINQITSQFDQVDSFYASLVNLMEKYANGSFHSGKITYRNIQQPCYHTPPILSQKLIQAIKPKCQAYPAKSMELIQLLRQGKYLELHTLAVHILALLPMDDPQKLMQYISEWAMAEKETSLLDDLFATGCAELRATAPQLWLMELETWLASGETLPRLIGLRAMIASVKDTQFAYLPNLYKLASELFMTVPQECSTLLEELLETFIKRSPAETSFFLRQILLRDPSPHTARLVRKKLGSLPVEYQSVLKSLLFDAGRQSDIR